MAGIVKVDVSDVSGVQTPIHKGLGRYVPDTTEVSGVSGSGDMVAHATADTAQKNQTYQKKPSIHAGCTADTAETCNTIDVHAANQPL